MRGDAVPEAEPTMPGTLHMPTGICSHEGLVYVVDAYEHCVTVFRASSGAYVRTIGGPSACAGMPIGIGEKEFGRFKSPLDALVVRGMLVVTEAHRLQLFHLDGRPAAVYPVPGAQNLAHLCADASEENIFLCDSMAGLVHKIRVCWGE